MGYILGTVTVGIVACAANILFDLISKPGHAWSIILLITAILVYQTLSAHAKKDRRVFLLLLGAATPLSLMVICCFLEIITTAVFVFITGFLSVVGCCLIAYLSAVVGVANSIRFQEFLVLIGILVPVLTAPAWLVLSESEIHRIGFLISICSSSVNIVFNKISGSALFGLPEQQQQQT
mmetsp:Transcript_55/g.123  ORF Transcript_55/g.123 Transcript_55/m.123 type:complete len:179 (-) Transcript_55:557-1093(-)